MNKMIQSIALAFCIFTIPSSAQSIYPFQSWMKDLLDFSTNTIFDIVLPGSRHSGMTSDDISTTPSSATSSNINSFDYSRISSLSTQDQKLWSARQDVSILNQLRSGARFLDLHIEASGSGTYNAYNGLLGADVSSIIGDIDSFIHDVTYGATDEIIIIYLSAFHGSTAELQGLYDLFSNSNLHSAMVPNSVDLTTKTLQSMLDDGKNIIAFSDDLSTSNPPNTFFDSTIFLHIPTASDANLTLGNLEEVHQVRSFVTSNIRHGWPSNTLNLIYWTRDIDPFGPFTQPTKYNSFREYNVPIAFELKSVIAAYRKLRFGNVVLVDFIASSDVVEQIILLNYEYSQCHDEISTCPSQTALSTYFKYDDPSNPCTALNSNLAVNCKRSCGLCPVAINIPGSSCNVSSDCNSTLYDAYGSSATGQCFIRKRSQSRFVAEPTFCLGLAPYEACGDHDRSKMCSNDTHSMQSLVSDCSNYCSADYQCADGYCNSEWSICMTLNEVTTTDEPLDLFSDVQKYVEFDADATAQYRANIDMFRPGDPDADYPEDGSIQCWEYNIDCFMANLDANPYVTSVLGLVLLIVLLSLSLCVCFTACCPFWCVCDRCCKKVCCRPCFGKTERNNWSMVKRWHSCFCLTIATIIVCALAIEGILANHQLYSDIFDESNEYSFVSASNRLFDKIDDKFGSASNVTGFITDNVENILDTVDDIMGSDGTSPVHDGIDEMYDALNTMANKYSSGISLSGQVMHPFTGNNTAFSVSCRYCDTIYDTVLSVNATLREDSADTLDNIASVLDSTSDLVNATEEINNITNKLQSSLDQILDISNDTKTQYYYYLDKVQTYHTQGETYVTALFALLFVFVVFPIFGMAMESKWIFKINWCLAMYCSVLLLVISVPFVFMLTLSADLCVRLDEFEHALPTSNSRLGRALMNDSALDVIATCFDDGSVLSMFNLSRHKQQMEDALHIDIAASFSMSELDTLQIEMDTLSTDEYAVAVDALIFEANSIPNCQCIALGVPFDRNNLNPATQCTAQLNDWSNCLNALTNASYAVQIENDALIAVEATQKIDALQRDAYEVFAAYHSMSDGANELIDKIQAIGCEVEPLFGELDELLDEFADCRLIGVAYEEFKTIGCGTIFGDVYIIARAVIIIAFFCLLIVLWSLCLDYVYGAIKGGDDVYAPINKAMTVDTPTVDTLDCEFATAYNDKDIEMQSV
eukprot:217514_1